MTREESDATAAALARRPRLPDLSGVEAALSRWESLAPQDRTALRRAIGEIAYHARAAALAGGLETEGGPC